MNESSQKKKKVTEVKTFAVPFGLAGVNETISNNTNSLSSQEQIISQALRFHSQGNVSEATKYYQQLIKQRCKNYKVYANYGVILKDLGKLKEAEVYTRKAIELNPDFAIAYFNLGNILRDLRDLKKAEIYTRKAIELNPDLAIAHYTLGNLLQDLGNLKEAEVYTRKSIKLNPNFSDAYYSLGNILISLEKLREAEIYTKKAIEIQPDNAEALMNLSLLLYNKGEIDSAVDSIEKAFSIDPISKDIKLLLSVLRDKKDLKRKQALNSIDPKRIFFDKIILKREVDQELINSLYKIKAIDLNKFTDPSFGNARGSDYKLFEDNEKVTKELEEDLISITKKIVNSNVFFRDSFFTILSGESIINKHKHLGLIDNFKPLNLWKQKYSLVYYLSTGDQDCDNPGILKMYEPNEEILPSRGMIIVFPANRAHSVKYNGKKDRIIIGVNFYSI